MPFAHLHLKHISHFTFIIIVNTPIVLFNEICDKSKLKKIGTINLFKLKIYCDN